MIAFDVFPSWMNLTMTKRASFGEEKRQLLLANSESSVRPHELHSGGLAFV
jgi:hypothetical protein